MKAAWIIVAAIGLMPLLPISVASQSISWEGAIARVEAAAEKYWDYARERGFTAGSMHGTLDVARHTCAILGRMLGHTEAIRHIEEMEYPPLPPDGDDDYALSMLNFAVSLDNWAFSARQALKASKVERIKIWNLDCTGHLGIPRALMMSIPNPEADFVREGTSLIVLGDIDAGFADRFQIALEANPDVKQIALGSNGGSVIDALVAGRMIRDRGLTTILYYNCNSACPLVFLGGVRRAVMAGAPRFGLHQISRAGVAVPADDVIYRLVFVYVAEMGGEPSRIIEWMLSASPAEMSYPEVPDYCDLGLATWVQRTCGW